MQQALLSTHTWQSHKLQSDCAACTQHCRPTALQTRSITSAYTSIQAPACSEGVAPRSHWQRPQARSANRSPGPCPAPTELQGCSLQCCLLQARSPVAAPRHTSNAGAPMHTTKLALNTGLQTPPAILRCQRSAQASSLQGRSLTSWECVSLRPPTAAVRGEDLPQGGAGRCSSVCRKSDK
jgi:hypothetical protein